MTRDNLVVWSYDSATANGNADYEIEVHGVQRLENGLTMIAESGRARIIEVDQAGEIRHEVALKVNHPHQDTRVTRKLPSGNYLVAHERDQAVREYSPTGEVIWEYEVAVEPNPLSNRRRARRGGGVTTTGIYDLWSISLNRAGNT